MAFTTLAEKAASLKVMPVADIASVAGMFTWHVFLAVMAYYVLRIVYYLLVYPYFVSPLRHLPGPKDHHFILGQHLNQFRTGDPEEPYTSWMRQWPREPLIRYFEFGHADAALINDLATYKDVMHTHCYSFVRTPAFQRLIGDIIGVGLVFAEGHEHRSQRKALGGLFTVSNIRSYLPVFQGKAQRLVRDIEQSCRDNNGLIEIKELFSKITLDVVGIFALGVDLNNFEDVVDDVTGERRRSEFLEHYSTVFDLTTWGMILAAVNLLLPIRWMPLRENKSFMHASKRLRQILTVITEDRIAEVRAAKSNTALLVDKKAASDVEAQHKSKFQEKDLLTYMIEEKYLASEDRWTKAELVEQVLNFMATGHETTASALTWAMHTLAFHPEVVTKLRAEVISFRASIDHDQLTFTEIEGLHYLDNVLRETIRLHCPAIEDVVVGGHRVRKGTTLMPVPSVIQRNPTIWGPDADEFNPDRWDRKEYGINDNPYAWVAFGHGPRACIGKALASLNFKIVLIEVIQRFDFVPDQRTKIEVVNPSGQIRPKGNVWLRAIPVTSAA